MASGMGGGGSGVGCGLVGTGWGVALGLGCGGGGGGGSHLGLGGFDQVGQHLGRHHHFHRAAQQALLQCPQTARMQATTASTMTALRESWR